MIFNLHIIYKGEEKGVSDDTPASVSDYCAKLYLHKMSFFFSLFFFDWILWPFQENFTHTEPIVH